MSGPIPIRLGDLLGNAADCSFFHEGEIAEWADGHLDAERFAAWIEHANSCDYCAELADDQHLFQQLTTDGVTIPGEFRAYEKTDARVREAIGLGQRKRRRRWTFLGWLVPAFAIAALLILLVLPHPPLIKQIEQVPLIPPPAVRGFSVNEYWVEIEAAWTDEDYATAEAVLTRALAEHPELSDLAFYQGLARLNRNDWNGAIDSLQRADTLQVDSPSDTTRWALATALDRAGRRDAACRMLDAVVDLGGSHATRARTITESSCR